MSIEDGQQVLPTEGFDDFADETKEEAAEFENQINAEQELNDENVAQLEADDPDDPGTDTENSADGDTEESGNNEADKETAPKETNETTDEEGEEGGEGGEGEEDEEDEEGEDVNIAAKEARDKEELSKKEKFDRYSRGVQRKINKEVKKREVLRSENEELRSRLDKIENRMSQETRDSEAAILDNRLRNATAIKQQLMEDGEFEQVAKVDNDIIQMRIKQSKLEDESAASTPKTNNYAQDRQVAASQQPAQQPAEQNAPYVPDLQTKWIQSNERFGNDVAYTNYVNSTYDALVEEGYDPESASMYDELNSRTGRTVTARAHEKAPAPNSVSADPATQGKRTAKVRPQSAPTPNVAQAQKSAASQHGITEADKINMRNWGLDPNSKEVRHEWLANKKGKK